MTANTALARRRGRLPDRPGVARAAIGPSSHYRPRLASLHWSYNLQFGRWLLAVSIAWLLSDALYRWIVGWQYRPRWPRPLRQAQAIVLFINPLLLTAVNFGRALSANRYAAGGMPELRRLTFQATLLVTLVAGVAFLGLALVGGPLVKLIFGEQFGGLGGSRGDACAWACWPASPVSRSMPRSRHFARAAPCSSPSSCSSA